MLHMNELNVGFGFERQIHSNGASAGGPVHVSVVTEAAAG